MSTRVTVIDVLDAGACIDGVKSFIRYGVGNGYGVSDGNGNGYGYGDGNGYGYGDGNGNGVGYGVGVGDGYE